VSKTEIGMRVAPACQEFLWCAFVLTSLHTTTCLILLTFAWPEDVLWIMTFGSVRLIPGGPWGDLIRLSVALLHLASLAMLFDLLLRHRCRSKLFYWGAMGVTINMGFWTLLGAFWNVIFMIAIWAAFGARFREFFPRQLETEPS
jgi:hypothetical protein